MYNFSVNSKLHEVASFQEFLEEFQISDRDLLFLNKFTYQDFLANLPLPCQLLFYEDYSTSEPSDEVVTHILQDLQGREIDRIIGVGGGSVLDTAKLLCIKDAQSYDDIYEERVPLVRDKGLILIPTTCGTGCEMTCVSVIDRPKLQAKIGKRIECNFADHAVLIPDLLMKIPHKVFACSAIDALIHAMEIFVNPLSGNFNKPFCREAIRLNIKNFQKMACEGMDAKFQVMDQFLLASSYAGIALSNDICGAVHACAMHFGGQHHVPHGESNYRFLVPVFSTYAELRPDGPELNELASIIRQELRVETDLQGTFQALDDLLDQILPRKRLREYGVREEDLPRYVERVYETQQRLLVANYVKMDQDQFLEIYKKAY
ncbi:Ethanolamine utilization protein EutG [uncultured Flavonifractor sp.]|nr:Ethanolamine utilization protein EutG [uncultured Flavonifractor sp.]